jgi:hypothetical protein
MRPVLVATLCALLAVPALAQTNPPGYTQFDLVQQAKLRGHLGTWQCVSVPAATPVSSTETEQGNWFVTRRTGASPATSYERWSHVLEADILIGVFDSGASDVAQTTSLDPTTRPTPRCGRPWTIRGENDSTSRSREPET